MVVVNPRSVIATTNSVNVNPLPFEYLIKDNLVYLEFSKFLLFAFSKGCSQK